MPNRFLRDGFLASLAANELRLYVLLVLAGDRSGLSFYHYDSICSILEMTLDDYIEARNALIEKDLIAYDGTGFQVLSLPESQNGAPHGRSNEITTGLSQRTTAADEQHPHEDCAPTEESLWHAAGRGRRAECEGLRGGITLSRTSLKVASASRTWALRNRHSTSASPCEPPMRATR